MREFHCQARGFRHSLIAPIAVIGVALFDLRISSVAAYSFRYPRRARNKASLEDEKKKKKKMAQPRIEKRSNFVIFVVCWKFVRTACKQRESLEY